jgi:hypothetical protein
MDEGEHDADGTTAVTHRLAKCVRFPLRRRFAVTAAVKDDGWGEQHGVSE